MVGTVLRGSRLPVACCAALTVAVLVGGCARVVAGTARAGDPQVAPARPIPVADLLIEPSRFPAQYPAAALPPKDVDRVLGEIDGVACRIRGDAARMRAAAGAGPTEGCRPGNRRRKRQPTHRHGRPGRCPRCAARVTQLADCPSFTSTAGGDADEVSEVTVDLPPAPPVDADDSYAVDQTVTAESAAESEHQDTDAGRPHRRRPGDGVSGSTRVVGRRTRTPRRWTLCSPRRCSRCARRSRASRLYPVRSSSPAPRRLHRSVARRSSMAPIVWT